MIYSFGLSPERSRACFFHITLKTPVDEWHVYRRYSEFDAFHSTLSKLCPDVTKRVFLPPKRRLFLLGAGSPEFLEERREALEDYLQFVVGAPEMWKDLTSIRNFVDKQGEQP